MKKAIYGFIAGVLLATSVNVIAGDITANGMYQGDVFTYLSNLLSLGNEQKTDYNALFASYTSTISTLNNITSVGDIGNYNLGYGSATVVTTTDLTLTGL